MHSCRYTACDHSYQNFEGGIQDYLAKQSSHIPDYWATQEFEVPSDELYSYFGPNGAYECTIYSDYEDDSSYVGGPNTQEQMAQGSRLNYLSGSGREYNSDDLYQSDYYNVYQPEPVTMEGSYCFKPKLCSTNYREYYDQRDLNAWQSLEMLLDSQTDFCPVPDQACYDFLADNDDSNLASESEFQPDLQSTNIIDAGYDHYADFVMEKWSSDEEVDEMERAARYKLIDRVHKAKYLCDGENMIKVGSNKYAKTLGSMGKVLKKSLTKRFKRKVPIPRQRSRELRDCPEE